MILEFSITNFLSFKNRTTMSMVANATNGLDHNYVVKNNKRILKTAAVYGANASGKTNLFKALVLIILMLRDSNHMDINAKLPIVPFKLDKNQNPSEFEIKFIVHDIRYVYGFKADETQIYEEYLYYYPKGKETKIFDRVHNHYSYDRKDAKILEKIIEMTANNKFFLATATNWNYEKTKDAYHFLTNDIGICFDFADLKNIAFSVYEENDEELKKFALDFLEKTDFNIEDYQVSKVDIPQDLLNNIPDFVKRELLKNPKAYQVLFKHKGSSQYLNLDEESLGTQMVFAFIPFIADTLLHQKVLIIDELDKSLHPFLVQYIIELFNNDNNSSGSQLIFNTHDTNILDLNIFRRDQIWFTEKDNITGESILYALSDFSVRNKENIEKGYMLGRYGAVPFIKNDWNLWDSEEE